MKKALALLFAAVLCLSLAACGGESNPPRQDGSTTSTTKNESKPTVPAEFTANLPKLCGEWKILKRDDVGKLETITIREDGTFLCDDRTLEWRYAYHHGNNLQINLFDGESKVGYFELRLEEDGDITGSVTLDDQNGKLRLYKPSHYEIINVTPDNWQDYFEIVQYMTYRENAFGEAESCFFRTEMQLKEIYRNRLSANLSDDVFDNNVIQNGALEFSYDNGECAASIDLANRTYTFGDFIAGESDTDTVEFGYKRDGRYLYAILETNNIGDWEIENGRLERVRKNFETIRLSLELCLMAE